MRASASLVAGRSAGSGRTRCTTLRSDPPLTLRTTGEGEVHLVGSAAGPVGGDELHLSLTVGAGARLTVRTVAATVVLPGTCGAPSSLTVDVTVGAGAELQWLPEPTVLVRGCDHRATANIRLGAGARLAWREVLVLGRHDEEPGSLLQRLRVDVDDRPLLRNDLATGPAWPASQGPAGTGGARAVGTELVVAPDNAWLRAADPPVDPTVDPAGVRMAVLPLDGPAALVSVLAASPLAALSALDAVARARAPAPI